MNAPERPKQRTRFDTVGKPRRRVDGRLSGADLHAFGRHAHRAEQSARPGVPIGV